MTSALAQIKEKASSEDVEVDLSGIEIKEFSNEIKNYLEGCKNIEVLVMASCGLTSLRNFPIIQGLQALDISNNDLSDNSQINVLTNCKNLTQIFLNDNKIEKMSTILPLKDLQKLIEIDCGGNKISEDGNYRETIFKEFKIIQIVDRIDKEGNQVEDEEEFEDEDDDEDDDDDDEEFDGEDFDDDEDQEQLPEEDSEQMPKKKTKKK